MTAVPSRPVVVVGAGIAGVACARRLAAAGLPVRVLDRGRRVGGRMAVRTIDERAVDLGASYFTVREPRFAAVVEDWRRRGLAREWTDTFATADRSGITGAKDGPMRWAAPHGLRSLVEDLAEGLAVACRTVEQVGPGPTVDGEPADTVVLAMPDPQARRLLDAHLHVATVVDRPWEPVLALAARWRERDWDDVAGVFVDHPRLRWVADDGARRGDGAPVLVAHSTPAFAREHLDDPDAAAPAMLRALREVLSIATEPVWSLVQRWTYAAPESTRTEPFHLSPNGIGLCGDGWSEHPRVEAAWLSGDALGAALARRRS